MVWPRCSECRAIGLLASVERLDDGEHLRVCDACLTKRTVRRADLGDEPEKAQLVYEARVRNLSLWKLEHEIRSVQRGRLRGR
jgi:hypothetical protein